MIRKMKYGREVITHLAYETWDRGPPSHLRRGITCTIHQNSVEQTGICLPYRPSPQASRTTLPILSHVFLELINSNIATV